MRFYMFNSPFVKFHFALFAILILTNSAKSQVFIEGNLLDDVCNGTSGLFYDLPNDEGFSSVSGSLNPNADGDGIDVFKIEITDASDVYIRMISGGFDSKVFLFDLDESSGSPVLNAVLQNDDDSSQINSEMFGFRDGNNHLGGTVGNPPSTFTNGQVLYMAVGRVGDNALNASGENVFETVPDNSPALVGPSSLTNDHNLASWDLAGNFGNAYSVRLVGAKIIGYSISDETTNQFNWTGSINGSMANTGNWMEAATPVTGATTDIVFDDIGNNNDVQQDISVASCDGSIADLLCVRSVDVNCTDFDFTLSTPFDNALEVVPYGRLCVIGGFPSRCFRITSPLMLDIDAVMVAERGEFLIDGSNGNNGTVIGQGSQSFSSIPGVRFLGRPTGNVVFNGVGSSGFDLLGNFQTEISLTTRFQGHNFVLPSEPGTSGNRMFGPVILDSFGSGSINGGFHNFVDTFVYVTGGDVFTLNTIDTDPNQLPVERFEFSSCLVFVSSGTELFIQNGLVTGQDSAFTVNSGSTLRNGGVDFRSTVFVDPGGKLTGTGIFREPILCDGILEPGNSAGTIETTDDIELSETTVTCIELGGTSSNAFDQINGITANTVNQFTLAGELSVAAIDGFVPQPSDEFLIMNNARIENQFENIESNLTFQIEYGKEFVRLFNFQSGQFFANSFASASGILSNGGIKNARDSDDQYVSFFPEFNAGNSPTVRVSFDSVLTTDTNINDLSLTIESRVNSPNLEQLILVFNWNKNSFETFDVREASFGLDSSVTLDLSDRIADFVGQNKEVRCRTRVNANGPTLIFPWQYSVDQIVWDIN